MFKHECMDFGCRYNNQYGECSLTACIRNKIKYEGLQESMPELSKIEEVPDWAKPSIEKLVDKDVLKGDNLNLSYSFMEHIVTLDRAGAFDSKDN